MRRPSLPIQPFRPFCEGGDDPDSGEDILSYWKRRLPLARLMVKKTKGRSLRVLTELIPSLAKEDATKDDSNILKKYEGKCRLTFQLHPKRIGSMTFGECQAVLCMLAEEGVEIPSAIYSELVQKRAAALVQAGNFAELVHAVDPWRSSSNLDPTLPTVCGMQGEESVRLDLMSKLFIGRCIVPNIMQGESKASLVASIAELAMQAYEPVDIVDLSDTSAMFHTQVTTALAALRCVVCFDLSHMEALNDVILSAQRKTVRSVLNSIGCAMEATPYYEKRVAMLQQARVQVAQHGPRMKAMTIELDNIGTGMEHIQVLEKLCEDYEKIERCMPMELFGNFGDRVEVAIKRLWTEASKDILSDNKVGILDLRGMDGLLRVAQRVFPSCDAFADASVMLSKKIEGCVAWERVGRLEEFCVDFSTYFDDATDERRISMASKVNEALDKVAGIAMDANIVLLAKGCIRPCMATMVKKLQGQPISDEVEDAIRTMLQKLLETCGDEVNQQGYELLMVGGNLVKQLKLVEAKDDGSEAFAIDPMVVDLSSLVARAQVKLEKLRNLLQEPGHQIEALGTMVKDLSSVIAKATELTKKAASINVEAKKSQFEEIYGQMVKLAGVHPDGEHWWHEVGWDGECDAIKQFVETAYAEVSTKDLKSQRELLEKRRKAYEEALRGAGTVNLPDNVTTSAHAVRLRLSIVICAKQMVFLLGRASAPDTRSSLTSEVKALREFGAKEKDVIPCKLWAEIDTILKKGFKKK